MYFYRIFQELNKRDIRYLVVGGVAVNLHGFVRATADLDIALALDEENLERFVVAVKEMGWKPRIPVPIEDLKDEKKRKSWFTDKNMKAFTVYNPQNLRETLDVLINFSEQFNQVYERREVMSARGISIPVASLNDIIEMKQKAGRVRDLFDIRGLNELRELKGEYKSDR